MPPRFGRSMRHLWELADDATFLNHGSFGACPKEVLAAQERIRREMESAPDAFFRDGILPREEGTTRLRDAAAKLAALVNVDGERLAFVENATGGVQAALRSVALAAGDRILITDHTYNAVRLMVEAKCAETGAVPLVVRIPLPADGDDIVERITAAADPSVKLAVLDHITSPTALVMPLERIIPKLRERGILVLVDGAHAVGQVPLDLRALLPDWYASNAHKWLYAPKGTAFLYASESVAARTRPNVVSHFVSMGFPHSFDWTGTRDNSAWLSVPAALEFHESLDPAAAREYQSRLLDDCTRLLASLGVKPVAPASLAAAMRSYVLPQQRTGTKEDVTELMRSYWERDRIQVAAEAFDGKLLLRISAQVYVDGDDLRRMQAALDRHGWPGRG